MPMVWNCTEEKVSTLIQGSWFTFAPGQTKLMDQSKADFIQSDRSETGLVLLDDRFDPYSEKSIPGFDKTEEGKKIMAQKREEGISNLINFHMDIVRNNQVSLRQDMANKYPTGDSAKLAAVGASKGEIESMRLVTKYKRKNKDNDAARAEEVEKLMQDIGPFTDRV